MVHGTNGTNAKNVLCLHISVFVVVKKRQSMSMCDRLCACVRTCFPCPFEQRALDSPRNALRQAMPLRKAARARLSSDWA